MRPGKILGAVIGGLLALLAAVLLVVRLAVHPSDYKARIEQAVGAATGRPLVLSGAIELSVFPWVALNLGPATLGNPPGFEGAPFLSVAHAAVRARLWPLLFGRLAVAGVDLDGLQVRLVRNAAGQGNWERGPASTPAPGGAALPASAPFGLQELGGLRIRQGQLRYENLVIENLNLQTGPYGSSGVVPVSLSFEASRGQPQETLSVTAQATLGAARGQHYLVQAVSAGGLLRRPGDRRIEWSLAVPRADVDLDNRRYAVPKFEVHFAGAQLNGGLNGAAHAEGWTGNGELTLAPLILREFLARLGGMAPKTRDPHAFAEMSAAAHFAYDGQTLAVDPLQVAVDDTQVSGRVSFGLPAVTAGHFALAIDRLDVERYWAPASEARPAPRPPAGARRGDALAGLDWQGTLRVGVLRLAPLQFNDLALTLTVQDRVARLYPLQAGLAGGRYTGDVSLDTRGSAPVLSLDESASGVDLARLASAGGPRIHLAGRAALSLKANAHGESGEDLLATMAGRLETRLVDGAIEGVDLGYQVRRAQALLRRQDPPPAPGAARTRFEVFRASAEINGGVAVTRDLEIAAQGLRVTGQGSANLVNQGLDLALNVDTPAAGGVSALKVPLRVTGPFGDPTIRPDVAALAKGQLGEQLRDALKTKLGGLFGRP